MQIIYSPSTWILARPSLCSVLHSSTIVWSSVDSSVMAANKSELQYIQYKGDTLDVIWVEKSPIIMQVPCWLKLPSPHCCQCLQKDAKQYSKAVAADVWTAN